MLLSINGIPIAAIELKNPTSGQTWQHAVEQYIPTAWFILPWMPMKSI
ncbi:MAG: hypothetical protein MUF15_27900 [Acidobacteria bacterium]|nr:hypothetical protein [Acidobacteriota bacterium]